MKPQEIDKLFREKLVTHSETPKTASWQQLNDRLQQNKKRKGMVYWRVAAAVLLLLSAIGFLYNSPATNEQTIAQVEQAKPKTNKEAKQPHADKKPVSPVIEPETAIAQQQPAQVEQKPEIKADKSIQKAIKSQAGQLASQQKNIQPAPVTAAKEETALPLPDLNTLDEQALAMEIETPEIEPEPLNQQETQEKVIIEYKPAGRKQVTLLAASQQADDTEEKSGSKVGKFLKKVKNTEIDLISLREAKNELIASRLQP